MKINQKFDKPLLILGALFILLGAIYQNRGHLPIEFSHFFFWLPQKQDGYYKLVEGAPDLKFGLLFFVTGFLVLVFRRFAIEVTDSDV